MYIRKAWLGQQSGKVGGSVPASDPQGRSLRHPAGDTGPSPSASHSGNQTQPASPPQKGLRLPSDSNNPLPCSSAIPSRGASIRRPQARLSRPLALPEVTQNIRDQFSLVRSRGSLAQRRPGPLGPGPSWEPHSWRVSACLSIRTTGKP